MTSLTSIPASDAPVPLSEIILSSRSTVVELTLVSVPLTNKLPLMVTFEPVNSKPPSTVVLCVFNVDILLSFDAVYVLKSDLT